MKKLTLAVLLALSTAAAAEGNYAGIKFESRQGRDAAQDANAYSLTVGKNLNQYFDAEVYARVKSNDDDTNNTRAEGAVIGKYPVLSGIQLYTRGAVGSKFDGNNDEKYWSLEPGVKVAATEKINVKAGLRFRDAFDANDDSTRTYRLGAEYALDKNQAVTVGYDRSLGDNKYDALGVGYGIKF
jgi:hypothetical protein